MLGTDIYTLTDFTGANLTFLGLREAFRVTDAVLYYNVNKGAKAAYEDPSLPWTFQAKYGGLKGNEIKITVIKDPTTPQVTVVTYFGTEQVNRQVVATASQLVSNDYVDVTVTDAAKADDGKDLLDKLVATTTATLTGGTTAKGSGSDDTTIADVIDTIETTAFDVLAITPDANITLHKLMVSAVTRLREEVGKKVTLVIPDNVALSVDYEGITLVANGVILSDGTELSPAVAAVYVAAASAAVALNQSLTYAVYQNAASVAGKLNDDNTIAALNAGKLVFTQRNDGVVVIEQDINSLHTFTDDKRSDLQKNRIIRALDTIAEDTKETFESSFIGKITNNAAGRDLFKSNRVSFLIGLQDQGVIADFVADDIDVRAGEEPDQVIVDLAFTPTDAMEKLYMTMTV